MQFCLNLFIIDMEQTPAVQDSLQTASLASGGVLYTPSSIQKKRSIMMYFLMGIVMVMWDKKTNEFEYFHLRQAIWWRISFFVLLLCTILLLFIPYIKAIGILAIFIWVGLFVWFTKQAWDGIYKRDLTGYRGAIFPSLGNWVVSLFDITFDDQQPTPNMW